MRSLRRLIAAIFGIAGTVGLALCAVGLIGCWVLYAEAVRRVDRTFGRAEDSLEDVRDGLTLVGDRLRVTRQELDAIRQREADFAVQPPAERSSRRALSRKVVEGSSPQLAEARRKLVTATEAALVLNGLLEAIAELPLAERVGVETDSLRDGSDRLAELIVRMEKLAATLAKASPEPSDGAAEESLRLCEVLDKVVAATDAGARRAGAAKERVQNSHDRIVGWMTATAVGLTVVLVWIGLGQLSLLVHGFRGAFRRRRKEEIGPCLQPPTT